MSYPRGGKTGKVWRAQFANPLVGTPRPIGHIRNVTLDTGGTVLTEPSAGTRTTFKKQASVSPRVTITFDVQRFAYITRYYCMNANLDPPLHDIYLYDGRTIYFLDDALGNTWRFRVAPGGQLQCEVEAVVDFIEQKLSGAAPNFSAEWGDDPLTHEDVTVTVVVSGYTNWGRLEWGGSNNVVQESLGQSLIPTEIYDRQAEHNGSYRVTRRWIGTKIDESQSGVGQNIAYAVNDVSGTRTFLYNNAIIRRATIEQRDLDLIFEAGEWEAENVAIT